MNEKQIFHAISELPLDLIEESALPKRRGLRDFVIRMTPGTRAAWAAAIALILGLNVFAVYGVAQNLRCGAETGNSQAGISTAFAPETTAAVTDVTDVTTVADATTTADAVKPEANNFSSDAFLGLPVDAAAEKADQLGYTIRRLMPTASYRAENAVIHAALSENGVLTLVYSTGPVRLCGQRLQVAISDGETPCPLCMTIANLRDWSPLCSVLLRGADGTDQYGTAFLPEGTYSQGKTTFRDTFRYGGKLEQYLYVPIDAERGLKEGKMQMSLFVTPAPSDFDSENSDYHIETTVGWVTFARDPAGNLTARAESGFDFTKSCKSVGGWCHLSADGSSLRIVLPFNPLIFNNGGEQHIRCIAGERSVPFTITSDNSLEVNLWGMQESGDFQLYWDDTLLSALPVQVSDYRGKLYRLLDENGAAVSERQFPLTLPTDLGTE